MAQNVTVAGASYSAVPSVDLPKTGGGTSSFYDVSDTTATASDVASGKVFYDASGALTTGTASGGGSSNIVTGTFTTGSTGGVVEEITVPYEGSGWPIVIIVYVEDGMHVTDNTVNPEWRNTVAYHATGMFAAVKAHFNSEPNYSSTALRLTQNMTTTVTAYKSSSSTATSYGYGGDPSAYVYSPRNPTGGNNYSVAYMQSSTKLKIFVRSSNYGFQPSITYRYIIIYSE